jgi:uncharacterized protein (TIGR02147 family)
METFTTEEQQTLDYRPWLCEEFTKRCQRNPSYSIRAFANLLGVNSSSLSQILAGKRKISSKMLASFIDKIGAEPQTKDALLKYALSKSKKNQIESMDASEIYRQMTLDTFAIISEWYHYAIMELTFVTNFKNAPGWIGSKLGISADEARIAIERLKRLNLLEEKDGVLRKTETFTTNFSNGLTSLAHKKFQKHILTEALNAIDEVPQEEKDITSMTIAIDEKKIPEARLLIKKFRRDLCLFMEDGEQTRVYTLAVQLYPISKS